MDFFGRILLIGSLVATGLGCGKQPEQEGTVQKSPEAVRTLLRKGPKGMRELEQSETGQESEPEQGVGE